MSVQSFSQLKQGELFEDESLVSSGSERTFEIYPPLEDPSRKFETIDLKALSVLATFVENRIHREHEFGCYEKLLQLVNLHVEGTPPPIDDNQNQLQGLAETFNLFCVFCGRGQFKDVVLDILKHNREVISDLRESQAGLTESCKVKFVQLFHDIQYQALNGSCTETSSPLKQSSCNLQIDNSNETVGNTGMLQTVENQILNEIKTSLSSETNEFINNPLLEHHEAKRVHAEISDQVEYGLREFNNFPTVFEKISVLAAKGKDSMEWAIIEKSKLNRTRNDSLVFAQSSMLLSIFNTCVSGLIQECDNSSLQTIMESTYYTKLIEISQCEQHNFVTFQNHIKKMSRGSGQINEAYFRKGFLRFLQELQQRALEITGVNRGSLEAEMKCVKFQTIVKLQQDLSIETLTIKNLEVEDICGACTEIIQELTRSHKDWENLIELFSGKNSPCKTLLKFLQTPVNKEDLLQLILYFMKDFKRDKKHKREELLMFWQEVRESVRKFPEKVQKGRSNSMDSVLHLFPQEYNEVTSDVSSIAEKYFTEIHETIVDWEIVTNINSNFINGVPIDSSAIENVTHTEFERFSENLKTLVSTTTTGRIANERTSNLFEEMSNTLKSNHCTESLRQMFSLFYAVLKRLLHDFLKDDKSDLSHTTNFFQCITDISAHMISRFIETEVLPKAQVCLVVARTKIALEILPVVSLEQETEMKWRRLQTFHEEITDLMYPGENTEVFTDSENMQYIPTDTLEFKANGANPETVVGIWYNFEKDVQNIPEIKQSSPTVEHLIENTNLFQRETARYLRERFETTCDYLTITKFPIKFFNEIDNVIEKDVRSIREPNKNLSLLEMLERERASLTERKELPNVSMRIPSSFKDFAADVDKDDALKRQDWVSILEAISKLKNIMSTGTIKEQTQIDEIEETRLDALLIEKDTNQNEETYFYCLRYQVRDFLLDFEKEKNGGQKLKTIEIPLQCLLENLNELIERLNKASAKKNVLNNLFAEEETTESALFHHLDEVFNRFDGDGNILADGSAEFRNKMKETCDWENSYQAKYRLLNFWTNAERVVKKFFREKAKNWKYMENFRISIEEFNDLQKSIYDLVDENLEQDTCLDDCNNARCDPVNYILHLRCVRRISFRRKSCPTIIVALIVILLVITAVMITVLCSNVETCIDWMST